MTTETEHLASDRPWDRPISANERLWIEVIRLATWDSDPPPTLKRVQQLRRVFEDLRRSGPFAKFDKHDD
ncbi:hypothetical protein [Allomesorhizobium alhagi]|uniref:Uncharacterized protein n=1 Tax=Mesorhizobium alhagi CCNWXJ12-2 TaxID=1107882 RepID=H0I080_9HYPH|nr:hypothetical protein [Mesorhizobium alhagi]EHK53626.1 hypothetical protein MAXJ12_29335 [Mesorhizobium alhagi CCNWXJ12-2]